MWDYGLMHFILITASVYLAGWLYAVPLLIVIVKTIDLILAQFGYRRLGPNDTVMLYETGFSNHNIGGTFEMEKMTFAEFKEFFIEKAVKRIPKMSSVLKKHFGIYFWKQMDIELGKGQVKKVTETNIKTEDDARIYLNKIMNEHMPRDKPLWEFSFLENFTSKTSMVFIRMHHAYTDGAGFVGMMSQLSDGKDKTTDVKDIPQFNIFLRLLIGILSPFIILWRMPEIESFKSDDQVYKMHEINEPDDGKCLYHSSKLLPFDKIRKCYKALGEKVTFNDYVYVIVSRSLKQWYAAHKVEGARRLVMMMPINPSKTLPKTIDDLKVDNEALATKIPILISDDAQEVINDFKPVQKRYLHPLYIRALMNFGFIGNKIPMFIGKILFHNYWKRCSISLSNLSLSQVPWYFKNAQILNFQAYANNQGNNPFNMVAITYRNELRLLTMSQNKLKFNPKMLLDFMVANIEKDIEKYCK